eukprot:7020663-Prymnesium_polylepis.1
MSRRRTKIKVHSKVKSQSGLCPDARAQTLQHRTSIHPAPHTPRPPHPPPPAARPAPPLGPRTHHAATS